MKRTISLFILILIIAAMVVAPFVSGLSVLKWLALMSPMLGLLMFSIWYAIFGWGRRPQRLRVAGLIFLLFLLISAGIGLLTRYEGSTSGASMPRLVWKWTEKEDVREGIETTVNEQAVDQTIEQEAASVATNFMGPGRDGMWAEVPFSLDWQSTPPTELWRRPIGDGWSSFAVRDGMAITQEQTDAGEQVSCLELLTGREIWTDVDGGVDFIDSMAGTPRAVGAVMGGEGPRATPTIYEERVYVYGSTGIAKCLDLQNGKLRWKRNVLDDHGCDSPKWGKSSSPLILKEEQLVVFTGGEEAGVTLVACDLGTGETKWLYEGQGASYSSPRVLTMLGKRQIVSVNQFDVTGHDPATGEELWRYQWGGTYPKVGQPQPIGEDRLLVTASYGVGSPLIQLSREGDKWQAEQVWKTKWMKTKFSTAVLIDDHAYGIDEGRLLALDLETGDRVWKRDKTGFGQNLLVGKDHLIIQTEPGAVVMGQIGPEQFTEKARLEALSSMTWNTPALAGRFLLVRNDREAVCYLLPKGE